MPTARQWQAFGTGMQQFGSAITDYGYKQLSLQEQKRANQIQADLALKKEQYALEQLQLQKMTDTLVTVGNVYKNRSDILESEMNSIAEVIHQSTGYDMNTVRGLFKPMDVKEGQVQSYGFNFDEVDTLAKQAETDLKNAQTNEAKADTALKTIDQKLGGKDFETQVMSKLIETPEYQEGTKRQQMDLMIDTYNRIAGPSKQIPPIQPGTMKEVELDMYAVADRMANMEIIANHYADEMLTYQGKFKNWILDKFLKAKIHVSPKDKKFVADITKFFTAVERDFMQYVHDVSGAQFSIKEMEHHKNAMYNVRMNPVQFRAAYNSYRDSVLKAYRTRDMIRRQGFEGEELGKEIDRVYQKGFDSTLDLAEQGRRTGELYETIKNQNKDLDHDQIMNLVLDRLYSEGYRVKPY